MSVSISEGSSISTIRAVGRWLQQWAQLPKDVSPFPSGVPVCWILVAEHIQPSFLHYFFTFLQDHAIFIPITAPSLKHISRALPSLFVCSLKGSILPFLFVVFARYMSNLKFYPKPTGFSESLPHILNCLNSPFSILLAAHILRIIISWPFLQYLLPKTHSLLVVEHVKFQESCKKNIHKALAHGILC